MSEDKDSSNYGAQVTPPTKVTYAEETAIQALANQTQTPFTPVDVPTPTPVPILTPVPSNYYDEEPVYVDKPTIIQSGLVTPPTQVSPSGTVIEPAPTPTEYIDQIQQIAAENVTPPTLYTPNEVISASPAIESSGQSPDALAGYGTTAQSGVLTDSQLDVLEDKVAEAVKDGTVSKADAAKFYVDVANYKDQRDQYLTEAQANQKSENKWVIEINGVKKTFDSYEEAELASIKSQKVTLLDPQGNPIVDSSGKPLTFDNLDAAHLYIERMNEGYIQSQRYANMTPTVGVGAWNLSAEDLMKNVNYMGELIDKEAENQKLYGSDILAGVLYSTGRSYRLGTGLVMGPALLPQTVYTAATNPNAIVQSMARDPIVSIANLAIMGLGVAEGYNWWKTRDLRWASKLSDAEYMELIEPESRFGLFPEETQKTNLQIQNYKDLPLAVTPDGYPTYSLRGAIIRDYYETPVPLETFKEASPQPYYGQQINAWDLYTDPNALRSLFGEGGSPLVGQPLGTTEGIVTSKRVLEAEIPWLEAEKPYFERLAGEAAAAEMSGETSSSGEAVSVESPSSTDVSVSEFQEAYPVSNRGQLPNPYYSTVPVGMVTSGVPLVGPGPLFYASIASLLSPTPNAPSISQVTPQINVTMPKIVARENVSEIQPILNLIDTGTLNKIGSIVSVTPIQSPEADIASINDQISNQIPLQEPIQTPIQEPVMDTIQEPIQEPELVQEPVQEQSQKQKLKAKTPKWQFKRREYERGEALPGAQRFEVRLGYVRGGETKTVEAESFHGALVKALSIRRAKGQPREAVVRRL